MSETLPCIILDRPQMAENIGSVARVMGNFGLTELRLVAPRDGWPQEKAWTMAAGAQWPLDDAKVYDTVEAATADLHTLYATTARNREIVLPVITPRACAADAMAQMTSGLKTGLLFGAERAGLETQDMVHAHYIVTIPVDARFQSLNLAQAVNIVAYEWRLQVMDAPKDAFTRNQDPPAEMKHLVGLYEHLEGELDASGFFFPEAKRPSMIRNLRAPLNRANLTEQEVRTWRGVVTALTKGRGRVLARLAKEKGGAGEED